MTRMFMCQDHREFLCDSCYCGQDEIKVDRYGEIACDWCKKPIPETDIVHPVKSLHFILVDEENIEKAKDVIREITRDKGLIGWEHSELDEEMLKTFKDHKREILYQATDQDLCLTI